MVKLTNIENRLERMVTHAEQAGSPVGVAQLSSTQIRALEFGSRLGGTGGFAPQRTFGEAGETMKFEININFQGSGRTENITLVGNPAGHHTFDDTGNDEDDILQEPALSESSSPMIDVSDEQPSANSDDSKQE
jgi:hypothetical protein